MFRKRNIIIVVVIVAVLGGWWYFRSKDTGETVQTETVRRGDVAETVSVTGELVPQEYADLSFPVVGTIDAVLVSLGDEVKKGTKLLSLDRKVLYSQWQEAQLAARIAEENEKSVRRNRGDVYTPEDITAKKLASEQARQKVATLQKEMQESILYAPFDGIVSQLDARVGEVASASSTLVRVSQSQGLLLEARVPESDIANITLGMRAKVTFDALSNDDVFEGEVIHIDPASTVVQDVVSYKVKFRLDRFDERLKEGMTSDIDIETAKRENVLWVPYRALTKEGEKTFAQVKQTDGTFAKKEVVTGLEGDEGTVEVRSGLSEGDQVTIVATQKK
jgi:RND family efflux transporter MFP subunit